MRTTFDDLIARIGAEYARLGYALGWRFLYSSRATLAPATRVLFVGINPGGGGYEPPLASVEDGNAYRTERWPSKLQGEVCALFERLSQALGLSTGWEALLDQTLTANVCPFRSPSWDALPRREDALRFSQELWRHMLKCLQPRLLVCNGKVLPLLAPAILGAGYEPCGAHCTRPTGWGQYTCELADYRHPAKGSLRAVQFPHLSRFTIMTSTGCRTHVHAVVQAMAEVLTGGDSMAPRGRRALR